MSDIRLKPCPFCGGSSMLLLTHYGKWHGWCEECGTRGPEKSDEASAADAWNCRSLDWISTAERMPDEAEDLKLLVLVAKGKSFDLPHAGTGVWHNGHWNTTDPEIEFELITYWMELPDIPEEAWK